MPYLEQTFGYQLPFSIDVNVLIINNYSYNLKRNISYWSKRDPKYANILSTKNHNICTKTQYDDLLYHANIIKQNNSN